MKLTIKIILWSSLVYCLLFGGMVWTDPIGFEQDAQNDSTLIAQADLEASDQAQSKLTELISDSQLAEKAQKRRTVEPNLLFLFGVGVIGFFSVVRKRI